MKIREAKISEVLSIVQTVSELDEIEDEKYFSDRLDGTKHIVLIAESEGKPAGFVIGYDRDRDGSFYCWLAGVNPAFRRRGIFSELMNYLVSWAKEKGYRKLKIKTRNDKRQILAYLVKNDFNFISVEQVTIVRENRIELEKEL
jgi:GNAT superfamily N-acetyltransferase